MVFSAVANYWSEVCSVLSPRGLMLRQMESPEGWQWEVPGLLVC